MHDCDCDTPWIGSCAWKIEFAAVMKWSAYSRTSNLLGTVDRGTRLFGIVMRVTVVVPELERIDQFGTCRWRAGISDND